MACDSNFVIAAVLQRAMDDSKSSSCISNAQVEVDIEFFDPKEADFHGIKTLLTDLLGGAPYNALELADAVIAQVGVTSRHSSNALQ